MNVVETIKVGSKVKILNCEECPIVVGRVVLVQKLLEDDKLALLFGRGRPQTNRPYAFSRDQLELIDD